MKLKLWDIIPLRPPKPLSDPDFLWFLFNAWGLWGFLVQTGAQLLLVWGDLSVDNQTPDVLRHT